VGYFCLRSDLRTENNTGMKSHGYQKIRIIVSIVTGFFLLGESLNPDFLRSTIESRTIFGHVFIALFGAACLVQAYVLWRKLVVPRSN
jgi:hypothetical protein